MWRKPGPSIVWAHSSYQSHVTEFGAKPAAVAVPRVPTALAVLGWSGQNCAQFAWYVQCAACILWMYLYISLVFTCLISLWMCWKKNGFYWGCRNQNRNATKWLDQLIHCSELHLTMSKSHSRTPCEHRRLHSDRRCHARSRWAVPNCTNVVQIDYWLSTLRWANIVTSHLLLYRSLPLSGHLISSWASWIRKSSCIPTCRLTNIDVDCYIF